MKDLGYGKGYKYAHAVPEAYIPQEYLPEELEGTVLYEPGKFGFEREIGKRLAWWEELRARSRAGGLSAPGDGKSEGEETGEYRHQPRRRAAKRNS